MKSSSSRNDRTLVCDTGPLLALARINFLPIAHRLFPYSLLTSSVLAECMAKPLSADACTIQSHIEAKQLRVVRSPSIRPALSELDPGEQSVLELALRRKATALIDEKRGRQLAIHMGVRVLGTLGMLLVAKQRGHIPRIMPFVALLSDTGYYLSTDLIDHCKRLASE